MHRILFPSFTLCLYLFFSLGSAAQSKFLKDLKKTAEEAAKRTVDRKVEEQTERTTAAAMDSLFNTPGHFRSKKNQKQMEAGESSQERRAMQQWTSSSEAPRQTNEEFYSIANQYIPNGEILYLDNFEKDEFGDFPSQWETNSGGEIITVDDFKALRTSGTGYYLPSIPSELPENYAVEFDLFTYNLDYKNSTPLRFGIHLIPSPTFSKSKKGASIEMPLWYKGASDYFQVETYGVSSKINNKIPFDYTEYLNDIIHFTLIKNEKRVRLFLNETKVVDIPSLAMDDLGRYIQFYVREADLQKDLVVALANLKITREGEDLRSKLLKKEGYSTTAILFETGSDQLQAASAVFLKELGKVLQEDEFIRLEIIGHTDSDGSADQNLLLSERRAAAVANYLILEFGIDPSRLQMSGKGESMPLNNNQTPEEKAANRRVEFKKF
ncbi:OmpA family protein [Algoriphagus namhaensis]